MSKTSDGKRTTKNKTKGVVAMRAQAKQQILDESSIPPHSSGREPAATQSVSMRSHSNMEARDPSDGADSAQHEDPPQLQGSTETDDGGGGERDTQSIQEEITERTHGEHIHSRIAERAFLLYAGGGFHHGQDLDHWLEAERSIMDRD